MTKHTQVTVSISHHRLIITDVGLITNMFYYVFESDNVIYYQCNPTGDKFQPLLCHRIYILYHINMTEISNLLTFVIDKLSLINKSDSYFVPTFETEKRKIQFYHDPKSAV